MIDIIIKTCDISTNPAIAIASYSHIIPIILSLFLGFFVFVKAKYNLFSKVFLSFIIVFSLWLIGDVIAWTSAWVSGSYNLIYTVWSFLLYLEIIFYTLGLYFALVFVKKSDISVLYKIILFLCTLPPFILTITKQSVLGFNQPTCEVFNNTFLDQYKLVYEAIILIIILILAITPFFSKNTAQKRKSVLIVLGSMFLFLSTFGITEYLAATTGYYEMNLYSLFLLPVFLVAIIYSVFELDIFNVQTLGTHYLVVGLIILMSGQLFFITNATNKMLTGLTIVLLAGLSIILFRNLKRESDQRVKIAELNVQLEDLIKQRENLVHIVNHKVKGSFTRSKYIFAGILDGSFGEATEEIRERAEQGLESDNSGIETVDMILNVANMQKGTFKYDMKVFDLKEMVMKVTQEKTAPAERKGLKMESVIKTGDYNVLGDPFWLREVVNNLVENSVEYTKKGKITVRLERKDSKILFSVKDTGMGITLEDQSHLFTEGGRGKYSVNVNVDSTGYGLFSVKLIVDAHKGRVWAESGGEDKGSAFFVELDAVGPE